MATRFVLNLRANVNASIRAFFQARSVLEVETPILSQFANTDPNIASFHTSFDGSATIPTPQRWLRTSPEHALKRLLAHDIGDCYELGRVFRNGEAGGRHNPEFTLLEWYRTHWNARQLAEEVLDLLKELLLLVNVTPQIAHCTYRNVFIETLNIDPLTADLPDLQQACAHLCLSVNALEKDTCLDLLLTHCIQSTFQPHTLTVLSDWPASQCALARINHSVHPPVSERFEVYLGQYELANGYHELTDPVEQKERFEKDNHIRHLRHLGGMPIDTLFLDALVHMPACAGVALGVDRLLMAMCNTTAIADVLAFPFSAA